MTHGGPTGRCTCCRSRLHCAAGLANVVGVRGGVGASRRQAAGVGLVEVGSRPPARCACRPLRPLLRGGFALPFLTQHCAWPCPTPPGRGGGIPGWEASSEGTRRPCSPGAPSRNPAPRRGCHLGGRRLAPAPLSRGGRVGRLSPWAAGPRPDLQCHQRMPSCVPVTEFRPVGYAAPGNSPGAARLPQQGRHRRGAGCWQAARGPRSPSSLCHLPPSVPRACQGRRCREPRGASFVSVIRGTWPGIPPTAGIGDRGQDQPASTVNPGGSPGSGSVPHVAGAFAPSIPTSAGTRALGEGCTRKQAPRWPRTGRNDRVTEEQVAPAVCPESAGSAGQRARPWERTWALSRQYPGKSHLCTRSDRLPVPRSRPKSHLIVSKTELHALHVPTLYFYIGVR